jgi:hypothetical protein
MHRLGVLRLPLALRLQLVDAALSFNDRRIDVRRHLVAPWFAAAVTVAAAATAATALLVATIAIGALATLRARIAGVRARQLLLRLRLRLRRFAFGNHGGRLLLRLLLRWPGLLALLRGALTLRAAVRTGPTIGAAVVALPVALAFRPWSIAPALLTIAALLAIAALSLEPALLLPIAVLVALAIAATVTPAVAAIASTTVSAAVSATIAPAIPTVAAMLGTLLVL